MNTRGDIQWEAMSAIWLYITQLSENMRKSAPDYVNL